MLVCWSTIIAMDGAADTIDVIDICDISLVAIIERVTILSEPTSTTKLVLASHGIPSLYRLTILYDDLYIRCVNDPSTYVAQLATLVRHRCISGVKLIARIIVTRGSTKLTDQVALARHVSVVDISH